MRRALAQWESQSMRLTISRILAISVSLVIFSGAALAHNCADFSGYICAKSTPDLARIGGGVSDGGLAVGILLNSNTFDVYTANGQGGPDVIIVAAFTTAAPKGSLNGIFFSSLGNFPEANGNTGAITSSLEALGLCSGSCKLSFGFVNLGTPLAKNGTVSVTASGVPAGTVFFAEVLNAKGQICY